MSRSLATLPEALEWAHAHWHENRVAPDRINVDVTDGELGGLRYSFGFVRTIRAGYEDLVPLAEDDGLHADRYRYPMWRALVALQNALRPRRQPHPYALVLDLADHGWDARAAAMARGIPWDLAEALYLRALRQLHGRFQQGPTPRPSWVDMSESARNAVLDAEGVSAA